MTTNTSKLIAKTEPMFSAIAARYDFCNHLFSFGLDFYWRKKTAKLCLQKINCVAATESAYSTAALGCDDFRVAATEHREVDGKENKDEMNLSPFSALDLCCGTGDMTFALADTGLVRTITACDVSLPMLDCAKRKHEKWKKTHSAGCPVHTCVGGFCQAAGVAAAERPVASKQSEDGSEVDGSLSFPRRRRVAATERSEVDGKDDSASLWPIENPQSTINNHQLSIDEANRKKNKNNLCQPRTTSINWLHRPAENTGLADASFDLITCAFGLRNVDDIERTAKEMVRLLKPGGRACILEFFLPQNKILRSVYLFYLCRAMPLLARWIAGASGPWHYLARSIEQWEKINLSELLYNAGFNDITIHPLTFSSVRITLAEKK